MPRKPAKNIDALTAIELDIRNATGCSNPACKHKHHPRMYIQASCHPHSAFDVSYDKRDHCIYLECAVCSAQMAIKVAET